MVKNSKDKLVTIPSRTIKVQKKQRKHFTNYNFYANIRKSLSNIKSKGIEKMTNKNNNKTTEVKASKKSNKNTKSAIIGIMLLFAVASIAYSTVVIAIGTEGYIPLVMVAPQAILAVVILVNKFVK